MLYGSLIRAVQQRVPLPYTFKLIDECLLLDSPETFLQKYISVQVLQLISVRTKVL